MAVIQISKMQVRRGQTAQTTFPQLSSGEFGWSIDQQELYIGNGAVSEGAPAVGNTRILTENDNLFLISKAIYTYGESELSPPQTNYIDPNNPIQRSLQAKLDDVVSVRDFGAKGDGVTDDTGSIQQAIDWTSRNAKVLDFSEGTYITHGTLYLPPNTTIRGAGKNKTIVSNTSTQAAFQTTFIASKDLVRDVFPFVGAYNNTLSNIVLGGLTIKSPTQGADTMLRLDCVNHSSIHDVEFISSANTSTAANAIDIRGIGALKSSDITIKDCRFYNLNTAIVSNYDIIDVTIHNNLFDTLNRGMSFINTVTTSTNYGPRDVLITENTFVNINQQGLSVGSLSTTTAVLNNIVSNNNYYTLVGYGGNGILGEASQVYDVITFKALGCYSKNDYFERITYDNAVTVANTVTYYQPAVSGPLSLTSNLPLTVDVYNGTNSVLTYPIYNYTFADTGGAASIIIELDYTLIKPYESVVRKGTLEVTLIGTASNIKDTFTYSGPNDGNVVFSTAVLTGLNAFKILANNYESTQGNLSFTYTIRQV